MPNTCARSLFAVRLCRWLPLARFLVRTIPVKLSYPASDRPSLPVSSHPRGVKDGTRLLYGPSLGSRVEHTETTPTSNAPTQQTPAGPPRGPRYIGEIRIQIKIRSRRPNSPPTSPRSVHSNRYGIQKLIGIIAFICERMDVAGWAP